VGSGNRRFLGKPYSRATRSGVLAAAVGAAAPFAMAAARLCGPRGWGKAVSRALFYLAIVLTLAGAPFLAALLLRVTIAGYEQIPSRHRLIAAGLVAIVAITSFGLGQFNNRFLTCNDFTVSGNDTPPGCSHGRGHLGNR
jgi:hypothetical protein